MGYFTFTLADKEIKRDEKWGDYEDSCKLGYGERGYIALPKGFENLYEDIVIKNGRGFIQENFYDGYGMFGDHDIYDVIVDINKNYLLDFFKSVSEPKDIFVNYCKMFAEGVAEEEIEKQFGKEWKRRLGIRISCYKEDNERLKFPLKVVSSTDVIYEDLPASDSTQ